MITPQVSLVSVLQTVVCALNQCVQEDTFIADTGMFALRDTYELCGRTHATVLFITDGIIQTEVCVGDVYVTEDTKNIMPYVHALKDLMDRIS